MIYIYTASDIYHFVHFRILIYKRWLSALTNDQNIKANRLF